MTPDDPDLPEPMRKLLEILYQTSEERSHALLDRGGKLAHYTSAENALNILSGRCFWLRNAAVMNDYSEIEHGRRIMDGLLEGPLGTRLFASLDRAHDGISNTIRNHYYHQAFFAREQTYMMSLCEHDPDDWLGRLSMWRAYGGPRASVALVLNPEAIFNPNISLGLYASPVLYGEDTHVAAEVTKVVELLEKSSDTIAAVDFGMVAHLVSAAMHFALLSTKHRGFSEEREWRILALASELPESCSIKSAVKSIGGIPQVVRIAPLHGHGCDRPANEVTMIDAMNSDKMTFLPQLAWDHLIDRIIVGPSLYPETVKAAIEAQLKADGVSRWDQFVHLSEIPLRKDA